MNIIQYTSEFYEKISLAFNQIVQCENFKDTKSCKIGARTFLSARHLAQTAQMQNARN